MQSRIKSIIFGSIRLSSNNFLQLSNAKSEEQILFSAICLSYIPVFSDIFSADHSGNSLFKFSLVRTLSGRK